MTAEERKEKKDIRERGKDSEGKTIYVDVRERVPRSFYISRKDAERFNQYTRGFPGGNSWFRGRRCHIMSSAERCSRD